MGMGGMGSAWYDSPEDSPVEDVEEEEPELPEFYKNDKLYLDDEDYGEEKLSFELDIYFSKENQMARLDKFSKCEKHPQCEEFENEAKNHEDEEASLIHCIEANSQSEMLSGENSYYCRNCKDHVESMKSIELYRAPPVLFCNLKRFKSSSGSYYKDKLEDKVTFPLEDLDLSEYILSNLNDDGSPKEQIHYELFAISNHYGNMGFGHYTAYAKNKETGKWYDFDDSSVNEVDPQSVISDAAYNLFYIRKGFYPDGNINFEEIKQSIDSEAFIAKMDAIRIKEEEEAKKKSPQKQEMISDDNDQPPPLMSDEQAAQAANGYESIEDEDMDSD